MGGNLIQGNDPDQVARMTTTTTTTTTIAAAATAATATATATATVDLIRSPIKPSQV